MRGVLKANVDPHDYEPSPADLQQIAEADVLVKNGVGLEKWFESSIKSAGPRGVVVDASIGQSLGGGVAMQLAYQHPELAERLVLVCSGGLGREVSWISPPPTRSTWHR